MLIDTLSQVKPTAADVLAILKDQHRHQCECDPETDPEIELTFESTVQEWRDACDLLEWKPLASALNRQWKVEIPHAAWKRALTPPKARHLREVCDLIAAHAIIERVTVPNLLGRQCPPAGVFFAVRELLRRDGADVADFRPSSLLSDYAIAHFQTFAGPISQLAPGRLPAIKVHHSQYDRASLASTVSFCGLLLSLGLSEQAPFLWIPLLVASCICWVWTWHVARHTLPTSVAFGELRTIRDVCIALAPGLHG